MKVAISLLTSFILGLMIKNIYEARRRLMASMILAAASFVFVMASILLGSVDLALQYEAQGFILWNAILGVATFFALVGLVCLSVAKLIFPKPRFGQNILALDDPASLSNLLEQFAQGFAMGSAAPKPSYEAEQERTKVKEHPRGDFSLDQAQPAH